MFWFWLGLVAIIAACVAIVVVRTRKFVPAPEEAVSAPEEAFDTDRLRDDLQELIRCRTVSYRDRELEDESQFTLVTDALPRLFPQVFAVCELHRPNDRSVLLHWRGKSSEKPTVLMAHYDVVPVDEKAWERPPFDAVVEDGVMWGRGTLDTKGTLVSVLEAADTLIAEGFVPEHDIWMAFAGDEEIAGGGAPANVAWLTEHDVKPYLVLDEGGAVVDKVFPGVDRPCAVIGTAEKGQMAVQFKVKSQGGHASAPTPGTPIPVLARAVMRLEKHPFPFRLSAPVRQLFNTVAPYSSTLYRVIFANLWLFRPLLNLICRKSGGELNALVRTTTAFTQASGSDVSNMIPSEASIGANVRVLPGDTQHTVLRRLKRTVRSKRVELSVDYGFDPSAVSRVDGEPYERLRKAVRATWPEALVTPYLMLACSDSRHYSPICDAVYRFSAMALSKEERGMIHGNNERIPLETLNKTVVFYRRFIRAC